ncbi:GlmL-related ornithine degradation protein [Salinispira pacifica]|uniref:Putative reactivating factor for D-ornithine aminomutase n=1 Tax=Salinispira pacifica TaxID=1307761 RepID=V5WF59_9SPIO|nr:GlmL-related ornithine degradation protein [Salinispira pacifica]AHC14438.1 putative reactivating factor for D-ornithine aminomutase [Salinispira pacifica]
MQVDILSAEIGSTTTVVSAFSGMDSPRAARSPRPRFLGQGAAPSSVQQGDVRIGLEQAVEELKKSLGVPELRWGRFFASSSAAGGLKMSVHGLAYDMTVKAAREAALGAGANISLITAGKMRSEDIRSMLDALPNIIMIAGGVDYGERDTALHNARAIVSALICEGRSVPVIYAGNCENHRQIRTLFDNTPLPLHICDNVYPRIDELVIEPARNIIQKVFEEHIVHAPGMEHIRDLIDAQIMPVPGAVMRSAMALNRRIGNLLVFDVGGATTDLHSVCDASPEIERILIAPEPRGKRTVEGDLGLYLNRHQVLKLAGSQKIAESLGESVEALEAGVDALPPVPRNPDELRIAETLCFHAAKRALQRHAGRLRSMYTISGKQQLAQGKDLSAVRTVIGTGGALTRLPGGREILSRVLESARGVELFPPPEAAIVLDTRYIMSSLGVLAEEYPEAVLELLAESLGMELPPEQTGQKQAGREPS